MGADQFGQRQVRAAGLEVPQGDVERRDGLGGDAGAADGCARPQQRLVDAVDVGRVLADRDVGDLLQMRELGSSARAFGVAEPHALDALFGGDLGERA